MTQADLLILAFLLGCVCIYYYLKLHRSYIARRQLRKAKKGEAAAIAFLKDRGFTITGVQEKKTIVTWVDKIPHYNNLKVDYIVKKRGKVYIAEIKTGEMAPRPSQADTRRQLLEYYLAYRPDGILLVDMEKKNLREIAFEIYEKNEKWGYVCMLVLAACFGLVCGYFLYKFADGGMF